MAFDNKQAKISKILKDSEENGDATKMRTTFERTKQYQFTLQPSVREKINGLAREKGYRSASSFINDYFKNL